MPGSTDQKHILIADDEPEIRKALQRFLRLKGYKTVLAENGREALDIVKQGGIDLVITDMEMPEKNGLQLLTAVKKLYADLPVVMITGHSDAGKTVVALRDGASDFINKPFRMEVINNAVARLLELKSTDAENKTALPLFNFNTTLEMPSKIELVNGVIHHLAIQLKSVDLCEQAQMANVKIALYEAIVNAVEHGNKNEPKKKVSIALDINYEQAKISIRDEGEGFDHASVGNPTDPENIDKMNGRGIYLMKHFIDEVVYNDRGNEVTMIINRTDRPDTD